MNGRGRRKCPAIPGATPLVSEKLPPPMEAPELSLPEAYEQWAEGNGAVTREGLAGTSKPWAVVLNPGQDDQTIWECFHTYADAAGALDQAGKPADVMKRLPDGTLTTEF